MSAPTPDKPPFEVTASRHFVDWLEASGVSIALTTYHSNRLFLVGVKPSGRLSVLNRLFERAMTPFLRGRAGSFVLQHTGTMTRGTPSLTITVVPDSGTGELTGLSGGMTILITDGKHSYELEYAVGTTT